MIYSRKSNIIIYNTLVYRYQLNNKFVFLLSNNIELVFGNNEQKPILFLSNISDQILIKSETLKKISQLLFKEVVENI